MKKIESYLPYVLLFTALTIDLIIFYGVMKILDVWEKEITAAFVGFVGSILGGLLILVGVKWTIKEQRLIAQPFFSYAVMCTIIRIDF